MRCSSGCWPRPRGTSARSSTSTQASGPSAPTRTASTSATGCGSRRTTSLASSDLAEHAARVVVGEDPVGVEALPNGLERLPFRVALLQLRAREVVALAPVRPAAVARHDLLDAAEVALERGAPVRV